LNVATTGVVGSAGAALASTPKTNAAEKLRQKYGIKEGEDTYVEERLYGKINESDEDKKKFKLEKIKEAEKKSNEKKSPLEKVLVEKEKYIDEILKNEEQQFVYFNDNDELKQFLTEEEKNSKKLSSVNFKRLYSEVVKSQSVLVEQYLKVQDEFMSLLGNDSAIKQAYEAKKKDLENMNKFINSDFGGQQQLAIEQNNLAVMQSREEENSAERAYKELSIKFTGKPQAQQGNNTGALTKQEKEKLDIEKAVEDKDLKTLGEKKIVEQKKVEAAKTKILKAGQNKLEANLKEKERQISEQMK